ncbi:MAG: hypothetical protein ACK55I_17925, partial [bacterium]
MLFAARPLPDARPQPLDFLVVERLRCVTAEGQVFIAKKFVTRSTQRRGRLIAVPIENLLGAGSRAARGAWRQREISARVQ